MYLYNTRVIQQHTKDLFYSNFCTRFMKRYYYMTVHVRSYMYFIKSGEKGLPGTVLSRKHARIVPAKFGLSSSIAIILSNAGFPGIENHIYNVYGVIRKTTFSKCHLKLNHFD